MRVALDTKILVSALMIQMGNPATIYRAWQEGRYTLPTCAEHLDELRATLRKPAIAERIKPYKAGGLVNELKELAENVGALPFSRSIGRFSAGLVRSRQGGLPGDRRQERIAGAQRPQRHADRLRARIRRSVRVDLQGRGKRTACVSTQHGLERATSQSQRLSPTSYTQTTRDFPDRVGCAT
jgi:hypothetical protein